MAEPVGSGEPRTASNEFQANLSSLTFSGGTRVAVGPADIVFIVGPNNSGKSEALRQLFHGLASSNDWAPMSVIRQYELERKGNYGQVADAIRALGVTADKDGVEILRAGGEQHLDEAVTAFVNREPRGRHHLAPLQNLLVSHVGTNNRLQGIEASAIDFGIAPMSHPLHFLHESPGLRAKLSNWFKRAFGAEIAVDVLGGSVIPIYVGEGAALRDGETSESTGYKARLRRLPRIQTQGDGMQSFVVLLLHTMLGHQHIKLVDEPEAFLHPPQARLLGRLLVEERPSNVQMVVATHSSDVLRGALEGMAVERPIRVLRLTRVGAVNDVSELTPSDIQTVWNDPVLRYTNVLDGIFHERVVVCEAEGDCRFYSAVADALRQDATHGMFRDVMFIAAGGKGGVPKLVKALSKLGVSVVAAVDFDILQAPGQVRALVEAFGADWKPFDSDYRVVKASIDNLGGRSGEFVRGRLHEIAASIDPSWNDLPAGTKKEVRDLIRQSIGWERAKSTGLALLQLGQERAAGRRLVDSLMGVGIAVVPCGQLEAFEPCEVADKNEWVVNVLDRFGAALPSAPELAEARTFVKQLISRPPAATPP